jgi:hypothetical protein
LGELARIADYENMLDGRSLAPDLPGKLSVGESTILRWNDVGDRFRELTEVGDLGASMRGQGQHRKGTQPEQRKADLEELWNVRELNDDPISGLNA